MVYVALTAVFGLSGILQLSCLIVFLAVLLGKEMNLHDVCLLACIGKKLLN